MSTHAAIPSSIPVPAGATGDGDGIALGSGPVRIDAYVDFLCPFCKPFDMRSSSLLDRYLSDQIITLVYHPLGFLDRLSTPHGYSSRAAGASACASDVDMFAPYKDALFDNQPEEGGPGLDEELVELGRSVGIDDMRFADGVFSGTYLPWAAFVTEPAIERGVGGTPTVLVAGVPVPANPTTIAVAVADLAP